MNQEQLSLETCQEIGHLFPESEKVYQIILDGCYAGNVSWVDRDSIEDWQLKDSKSFEFINHPSITAMMEWLAKPARYKRVSPVRSPRLFFVLQGIDDGSEDIELTATTSIEAYAEAVKIVMKEIEK